MISMIWDSFRSHFLYLCFRLSTKILLLSKHVRYQTDLVVAAEGPIPSTMTLNPLSRPSQSNGYHSPLANSVTMTDDAPYESDSILSETQVPTHAAATSPSTTTSPEHQSQFGDVDLETSDDSGPENGNASDDADFDIEDSPAVENSHVSNADRASSHDSRRPPKRKQAIEDDEFIKANPELYGLRRSVCLDSA